MKRRPVEQNNCVLVLVYNCGCDSDWTVVVIR